MKNINRKTITALLAIFIILISTNTSSAQSDSAKHGINICAIAIPTMNVYVLNYEYLYKQRHGLATRIEFAPNMKDGNTEAIGTAFVANYRYHFTPKLSGFFAGPYARYRHVIGSGVADDRNFDFTVPEFNLGIHAGYRWVSEIGFNVVFSYGYGYSWTTHDYSIDNDAVRERYKTFTRANSSTDTGIDAPFYAELSFGWVFK